jgi:hypothetical protein
MCCTGMLSSSVLTLSLDVSLMYKFLHLREALPADLHMKDGVHTLSTFSLAQFISVLDGACWTSDEAMCEI